MENNNAKRINLTFGEAIEVLQAGGMIARDGWNGSNMFVFKQVPSIINKTVVPKMTSLPQSVKDEFQRRFDSPTEQISDIYDLNLNKKY